MGRIGVVFLMVLFFPVMLHAEKYKLVLLETNQGNIKLKLYEDTPKHSENFLKLVKEKHYDGLLFHRVIKDFMIQGGSSDSRGAEKGKMLGLVDPGYTIDAEIVPQHVHKKGALCAARQSDEVNPEKKSSAQQFYIVQGKTYSDQDLDMLEKSRLESARNKLGTKLFKPRQEEYRGYAMNGQKEKADSLVNWINQEIQKEFKDGNAYAIPANARNFYKSIGGTPFLDGEYTVFGEVVEGMDIIDKIASQKTGQFDRPEEDIVILKARLVKK